MNECSRSVAMIHDRRAVIWKVVMTSNIKTKLIPKNIHVYNLYYL